jgi:uncharacterized protein YbjT (DUF2867 family)
LLAYYDPDGRLVYAGRAGVSSVDVARAIAAILDDPAPHISHIYDLTGPESADLTTTRASSPRRSAGRSAIATRQLPSGTKNFGRRACPSMSSTTSR